jgi:hypothetical protein
MQVLFNNFQYNYSTPYINKFQPVSFKGIKLKPTLVQDTFTKSNTDFLSLPKKDIFAKIKQAISNNTILDRGGEAEVFALENTNYCVRLPYGTKDEFRSGFSRKLSEKDKINHTVIKLGNGATIMPIIKGFTYCRLDQQHNSNEIAQMVENMPQEAYNKLFTDICTAKEQNLIFDAGWKNVIINPENKTMTPIDFFAPPSDGIDYDELAGKVPKKIFITLAAHPVNTVEQKKKCAGKIILAALNELKSAQKAVDETNYDFSTLFETLQEEKIIENPKYLPLLTKLFAEIQELKKQELEGIDINLVLNGRIKIINSIIRQQFGG